MKLTTVEEKRGLNRKPAITGTCALSLGNTREDTRPLIEEVGGRGEMPELLGQPSSGTVLS